MRHGWPLTHVSYLAGDQRDTARTGRQHALNVVVNVAEDYPEPIGGPGLPRYRFDLDTLENRLCSSRFLPILRVKYPPIEGSRCEHCRGIVED